MLAHARRKFFALADVEGSAHRAAQGKAAAVPSPVCLEAVQPHCHVEDGW